MDKIALSNDQKRMLLSLSRNIDIYDIGMSRPAMSYAADELENNGLIRCAWGEGHTLEAARLTNKGTAYIDEYPDLDNPEPTEMQVLEKENLVLQNENLRHEKKMRKWKILSKVLGKFFPFLE